jgi:hypothetical protein
VIDKDNEKQHENPEADSSGSSRIIIEEKRAEGWHQINN